MKRLVIKLSILSVVAASGLIAIAQGRNRGSSSVDQTASDAASADSASIAGDTPQRSVAATRNSLPTTFDPDILPAPARARTMKTPAPRSADDLPDPEQ